MTSQTSRFRPSALSIWALLLLGIVPGIAAAGTFSVSPVRIFMQARERATAVTIQNEGTTELVMQADVFAWKQSADGVDELVPTEDIILAPPILRVAPGARQVVRLAHLRPPPASAQQTYRLIVREIPEAQGPSTGVNVQVALAFSLPVFITPPTSKSALTCKTRRTAEGASVTCENGGQAYAQPVSMSLSAGDGEGLSRDISGGYILPQARRTFDLGNASKLASGTGKLSVTLDDGSKQTFDVQLTE